MKKMLIVFVMLFILFTSLIVNAGFVMAEDNTDDSIDDSSDDVNDDSEEDINEDSEDEVDGTRTEIEVSKDDEGRRVVTKKIISTINGVETERKIVTSFRDGKTIIEEFDEKRKFIDSEGNEREIKIELREKIENGETRRAFKLETDGQEVEIEDEIELNETNENGRIKIKAKLRDGSETEIKILPERASETARDRLRLKFGNESVVIKEIEHKNIPRVVYHIEGNQSGKFLGIFKTALRIQTDIDAETGEVIVTNGPWWSFLVSQPSEDAEVPIEDNNETQDDVDLEVPVLGNETVNETVVVNMSSNVTV